MSTPNFTTQKNFNLYLWDYKALSKNELEESYREYYSLPSDYFIEDEDLENFEQFLSDISYRDIIDTFETTVSALLKQLKRELNFHEITLRSGYYCGLQFFVELNEYLSVDFEREGIEYALSNITNEDTKYYFDMCYSEFKRKYISEVKFINKKLLPKLAEFYGFERYVCVCIFSNGEAIYEKVNNSIRQALKEVA